MALSATFAADFSSFTQACAKAEVSLKGIESGAAGVDARLTKMADSLSGTKIIQQASIMAEAVERVGGVSTLTAKELQRVGATATEAAEKLRILGQEVPPGIQKIADAAKAAQQELDKTAKGGAASFEGLIGSLKNVAGAFGLAFGAGAVISGVERLIGGAVEMASAIGDTSAKLGVSAEKLQGWNSAAELAGATSEDISTAVAKMNANLDGGSKSTVDALKAAGLQFSTIRSMKPEDAFEAIATAIAQIPDPMTQARVAVELFGKGGQTLLPAIKDNFVAVGDAAKKMSDEEVKQLKAAGDAWKDFSKTVTIVTGEVLIGVTHFLGEATSSWKNFGAFMAEAAAGGVGFAISQQAVREAARQTTAAFVEMGPSLELLRGKTHQSAEEIAAQEAALKKAKDAAAAYAKQIQDLADKFSGTKLQQEVDNVAAALNRLSAQGKGLTASEFQDLGKWLEDAKNKGAALDARLEELYVTFIQLHSPIAALAQPLATLLRSFPDLGARLRETQRDAAADATALANLAKEFDHLAVPFKTFLADLPHFKLPTPEVINFSQSLGELAGAFQTLAQVSGNSFGGIPKAAGSAIAAVNALSKGMDVLNKATDAWNATGGHTAANFTALAAGGVQAGAAMLDLFLIMKSMIDSYYASQKAADLLADHLKALADVGKDFPIFQRQIAETGATFGAVARDAGAASMTFSDQLIDAIQKSEKALTQFFRGGSQDALRFAAEALNLSGIIRELGGVTDQNIGLIEDRMSRLFDLIKLGGPTAGQAIGALNSALGTMADYLSRTGGLWDNAFQAALKQTKDLGLNLASINDLMAKQQSNLETAIGGVTGKLGGEAKTMLDLKKTVTEAQAAYDGLVASGASQDEITKAAKELKTAQDAVGHATVTTQAEFDRLNRIALATFNTLVASGKSPIEAMKAIGGSIDDLLAGAQAFGLGSTEAFDTLSRWRELTKTNEPLLNQISSLNELMVASANLGGLTASSFADMQAQGVAAYDQLVAAGFTQQEAELAEKPLLESIIKLHKDKGLAIDDATQKLIDQATQDGILGAQEESTQDVLKEGLGQIITLLGGELPEAWRTSAQAGTDAAAKITGKDGMDQVNKKLADQQKALKDETAWKDFQNNATKASGEVSKQIGGIPTRVNVEVNYSATGSTGGPPAAPGPSGPTPNPASRGGLVTATGIEYLQTGGPVWTPHGTDTVPAMLTPGERVLSVAEARRYRSSGGGGTVIVMLDGRVLAQAIVPEFEGAVRRLGFAR